MPGERTTLELDPRTVTAKVLLDDGSKSDDVVEVTPVATATNYGKVPVHK